MTELLLICAIGVLGVAFSVTVARWLLERSRGGDALVEAVLAVNGGASRFLVRQHLLVLTVSGVVAAVVLVSYGVAYQFEAVARESPRALGLWQALTVALGATVGVLTVWVGSWVGREAGVRVAAASTRSLDEALQIGMRAGAISGVVAMASSVLGLSLLILLRYGYLSIVQIQVTMQQVLIEMVDYLPGFLLGAALSALLAQLAGGVFGKVADVGADVAGKLEASLREDDPDNPAAIADLVGDIVGDGSARTVALFAAATLESFAAMWLATQLFQRNQHLPSASAVALFPLVICAFGLLATWFGVMVVRTDDTELPSSALIRGMWVTSTLFAVGAVGAAKWLLGEHWLAFGGCAAAGALWSVTQLLLTQYYSDPQYRPVRVLAEAARGGATLFILRGLVTAAEGLALQLSWLALIMAGGWWAGGSTGLEYGGLFGVAVVLSGMLGSGAYAAAMDQLGSVADGAAGIIEMTVAAERPDVRARVRSLDAVGTTTKAFSKTLITVVGSVAAMLGMSTLLADASALSSVGERAASGVFTAVGAVMGLIALTLFGWLVLRHVVASSRQLVNDLRAQLGNGEPPSLADGGTQGDGDSGQQRQLACVEICSRVALRGVLLPLAVGLGVPLFTFLVLRLVSPGDNVRLSTEAVVALLLVAAAAAAIMSLIANTAATAWDNAKKYIETGAHGGRFLVVDRVSSAEPAGRDVPTDNPTYVAAVIGDTIGDPLKGAVAPAAQALVVTLAALVLVFLPLLD